MKLTDKEILAFFHKAMKDDCRLPWEYDFARLIETAVERNTAIACYEIARIGFNRSDSEWTMDEIAREFHLD